MAWPLRKVTDRCRPAIGCSRHPISISPTTSRGKVPRMHYLVHRVQCLLSSNFYGRLEVVALEMHLPPYTEPNLYVCSYNATLWLQDVKWLQTITKLPILVKGIITAEDSKCCCFLRHNFFKCMNADGKVEFAHFQHPNCSFPNMITATLCSQYYLILLVALYQLLIFPTIGIEIVCYSQACSPVRSCRYHCLKSRCSPAWLCLCNNLSTWGGQCCAFSIVNSCYLNS